MADAQLLSMANDKDWTKSTKMERTPKHFWSSKSVTSIAVIFGCASICCKRLSFASESFRHAHLPLYVGAASQCVLAASTHGWKERLAILSTVQQHFRKPQSIARAVVRALFLWRRTTHCARIARAAFV